MIKKMNNPLKIKDVKIEDTFFSPLQDLITDVVIPYQEKILHDEIPNIEKSHAIENFEIAAGLKEGEFYGYVFQDSDVAKWLEAVAYSLTLKPDEELEKRADKIIELIGKAQQEDGYLDTYFIIKEPDKKWNNLMECHELYCAGHMIEAGVAYYESTGKDNLLKIVCKLADCIDNRFGKDKVRGVPGHEEIELALLRLYTVTNEERYLNLAKYFIDERGQEPEYFKEEDKRNNHVKFSQLRREDPYYRQVQAPVRQQTTVEGHSVRVVYLLTGMADLASRTNDQELFDACDRLWDNMVNKRMYITGGIGSNDEGEAFTIDYDLPNDSIYAETCASVGLCFFAKQMLQMKPSNKYADILEKCLYNGTISGMQLDGKKFFYVNPLEVVPGVTGELFGFKHVLTKRPEWYACACCPPNLARLIGSLGTYIWAENDTTIYSHLFIGGKAQFKHGTIDLESNYPWNGHLNYTLHPIESFTLAIRKPGWCDNVKVYVNGECATYEVKDGYMYLSYAWKDNDVVEVDLDMPVVKMYANAHVRSDAGCVAFTRGPVVYCFEHVDNDVMLQAVRIPRESKAYALEYSSELNGIVPIEVEAIQIITSEALYSKVPPQEKQITLKGIPYYTWGNRETDNPQMRVWLLEK